MLKNNFIYKLSLALFLICSISVGQASVRYISAPESSAVYGKIQSSTANSSFWHNLGSTLDPSSSANIWDDIRSDFSLDHHADNPLVQAQIHWFERNPVYFVRICKRAQPYLYYIFQQVKKRHVPGELVLLPMIESAYNPFVSSDKGAAGLWQIMPPTATNFGLQHNWWYDGRRDVFYSTQAALNYFVYLRKFFDNNWMLAIAAYDSGEGTVYDAMRYNAHHGRSIDFWDLNLPQETQAYVPRLLAIATIINDPEKYGIKLPPIKNVPYFEKVNVGSQIDLAYAAKLARISTSEMYILNPGFNRWATSPNGRHTLLIPIEHVSEFKRNLAKLPKSERVTWRRHVIKAGETLSEIADHYQTSTTLLRAINKLRNDTIRLGTTLFIPIAKRIFTHSSKYNHLYHIPKYLTHNQAHEQHHRIYHIVRPGDSLWKIAHDNGVSIKNLRQWNHFSAHHAIRPGSKVLLWKVVRDNYQLAGSDTHRHHPHPHKHLMQARYIRYKVKTGDNLIKIAHRHHLTSTTLKAYNHLKHDVITLGQIIKIPVDLQIETHKRKLAQLTNIHKKPLHKAKHSDLNRHKHKNTTALDSNLQISAEPSLPQAYKVEAGDTLSQIAAHFHLSVDALKHENGLSDNSLQIGQVLSLPSRKGALREQQYKVKTGDTLSLIAKHFGTTPDNLKTANQLHNNVLHLNQVLIIPRRG